MKPLHVVIPTYNRKVTLKKCLKSLEDQSLDRSLFSVTVIDDGSGDGTDSELNQLQANVKYDLQVITQSNLGAGAARNSGVFSKESEYIVLIGDDILPQDPNFLKVHYEALRNADGNTVFIGYTTWHPELSDNRFRHWLENGGPQFDFRGLKNGQFSDFWHFYTSNLSIPTTLFKKEAFDNAFTGYGWEDIELGYRLVKKHQTSIRYLADAKAWHLHDVGEEDIWNRAIPMKEGAQIFESKHPELAVLPKGYRKWMIYCVSRFPVPKILGFFKKEWEWYIKLKKSML